MKKKSRDFKFTVFHGEEAKKILIIIMIIFSQCIFFSSDSFRLNSMEIKGLSQLNGKDIAETSSPYWKKKHILFVNVKAIKEKLSGISWVENSTVKKEYPNVHFMCGLSNVSYGLPNRKILNRIFMVQTMTLGMDGYILNPTDRGMMGTIFAAQALMGQDLYCMNYLSAHRAGVYEELSKNL